MKVILINWQVPIGPSLQCRRRYPEWLEEWCLCLNAPNCTKILPWCRSSLFLSARRQKWWRCSPQGLNILTTLLYSYRYPLGRHHRHRRDRRWTHGDWSCEYRQYISLVHLNWDSRDCSIRTAGCFACPPAPEQSRWRWIPRAHVEVEGAPEPPPSHCHRCLPCFLSAFKFQ